MRVVASSHLGWDSKDARRHVSQLDKKSRGKAGMLSSVSQNPHKRVGTLELMAVPLRSPYEDALCGDGADALPILPME